MYSVSIVVCQFIGVPLSSRPRLYISVAVLVPSSASPDVLDLGLLLVLVQSNFSYPGSMGPTGAHMCENAHNSE